MAVIHIKATGTKSSGKSTADDWANVNCYPLSSWTAAVAAAASGDELIFDDDLFVVSTTLSLNNALVTSTLTVKSRSGGTRLRPATGATQLLVFTDTDVTTLIFEDLTFDGLDVPWTATGTAPVSVTQQCPSLTLNRCAWTNWQTNTAARTTGLLLRYAASSTPGALTMNDCRVDGVTVVTSGDFQGLFKVEDNDLTWTIDGLELANITAMVTAGNNLGLIYQTNTTPLSLSNIAARDIAMTGVAGGSIAGIYRAQGTPGALTVADVTADKITLDGPASTEGLFKVIGTATVRRVTVNALFRTGSTTGGGNSIGGVLSAQGTSAAVTVEDLTVTNSGGFFGTAFYSSGGASLVARRCAAIGITDYGQVGVDGTPIYGLAFYSGGNGNATWHSCIALQISGVAVPALAWYAHHSDTGGINDKSFEMLNCTIDCGQAMIAGQTGGVIRSQTAGQTFTATVMNSYLGEDAPLDIIEMAGTTLNATLTACGIPAGTAAITESIATGSYSIVGTVEGEALFTGGTHPRAVSEAKLRAASPLRRAGICALTTGCAPHDFGDRRARVPPDIGAWQRN